MNEDQSSIKVFRFNIFLLVRNLVLLILFLGVAEFFSNVSLIVAYKFIVVMWGLLLLYYLASQSIAAIKVDCQSKKIEFILRRFVFRKSIMAFEYDEFYFSYKQEIGGRGSKHFVLTVYNVDKEEILKITPGPSGWSDTKITDITNLWREIGVEEIT